MNGTIFCDVMCSLIEVYWLFGTKYCLHFEGRRIDQESRKNQRSYFSFCRLGLLLDPEGRSSMTLLSFGKFLSH
jgi:hypothetical protein